MYVDIDKIKEIVLPLLESYGIDLVDLHFHRGRKKINLKFLVDKPSGGISLDECAKLNEDIGDLLEKDNIIQESFILEVSSPGLDRPLLTAKDFLRAKDKEVRIFLREPVDNKIELKGKIIDVKQDIIVLGFATALAIGISGLWGAFLSEEAERKKKMSDLKKDMVDMENPQTMDQKQRIEQLELEIKEIKRAMVTPIDMNNNKKDISKKRSKKRKDKKSVIQEAEDFATLIASLVDGGAPVLGSSLPLIPFFFGLTLTVFHFIFSYVILLGLLIYLGLYLGKISGGGGIKYALHLVTAGVVTLLVSLLLGV